MPALRLHRAAAVRRAWRSSLPPLPEAIALARQAFPRRGRPQEWNLCLCHLTRRRDIARAQKERLRREKTRHYLSLDGEAPLGAKPSSATILCLSQNGLEPNNENEVCK